MVDKNWGKGTLALTLRSNPDMEEKGIVGLLPELSCRTAAELPMPDFSAPGGHPPEQPESFGGS